MSDPVPSKERDEAIAIANRLLDEPMADPDDDLRVLARQFMRALERVTAEPAREYPDPVTAFQNLAAALPPGFEFPTMEADTSPLTHQEIFSAVLHHASEIVRLTAAVPAQCSAQPPGDDPMRPTMFGGAPAAVVEAVAAAVVAQTDAEVMSLVDPPGKNYGVSLLACGGPIPEGGCGCRTNGVPIMRAQCKLHGDGWV